VLVTPAAIAGVQRIAMLDCILTNC
jgi:hypothetical protein